MSNHKSVIVSGEAPETDSEDEKIKVNMKTSIIGAVIAGEDSESEDENASVSSAVSALNQTKLSGKEDEEEIDPKYNTLLHRKLRECNSNLYTDVDSFCQNVADEAQKNLNSTDQHLLNCQLTVQAALSSLKNLTASSNSLKNKLHSLLSAKFIPSINLSANK